MTYKQRTLRTALLVFAVSTLLLAACTPKAPAEPTLSPDAIYTAAAQTVAAEVATKEALNPTATMTFTPLPTNTQPVVSTQQPVSGTPGAPVTTSAATTAAAPLPTFTQAAAQIAPSAAKYELVSQEPADNSTIQPGVGFDAAWVIKNTGTTTWTKEYSLAFFIGERMNPGNKSNVYTFVNEVKPGETIRVAADMAAPTKAGEYYSWWKLKDDQGQNFGDVDITIKVP